MKSAYVSALRSWSKVQPLATELQESCQVVFSEVICSGRIS